MEQLFKGMMIQNTNQQQNYSSANNRKQLNKNIKKGLSCPTTVQKKKKVQVTYTPIRQPKLSSKNITHQPSIVNQLQQNQTHHQYNNNLHPQKSTLPHSDLDMQLVIKAMNNSYMQQLSQGSPIQLFDMLLMFSKSLNDQNRYSMSTNGKIQDLKYYFKIVQIDQSQLFSSNNINSNNLTCFPNLNLQKRVKYQLIIKFDGKQMQLQSFQQRNKQFYLNFDTIQCKFIGYQLKSDKQANIKIKVAEQVIDIYFTQNSLPGHFKMVNNQKQIEQMTKSFIKHTSLELSQLLKKFIQKSRGYQFKLRDLFLSNPLFHQKIYSTQQQFSLYCQTGDILLFKDNHTFAKLQRTLTNSQYDHIAFVYRSQKYGICLVQSSSGLGVGLSVWTHLIRHNWFKGIQCISWRRLCVHDKQKDFQQKITHFVNMNLHKKYGFSVGKMFRFHSYKQSEEDEKNRTYFCSQLVAQLYKQLGLLDKTISSTQYWPKHFSDNGHLSMLNNSALEHERILVFNSNILKQNYRGYKGY